MSPVTSGAGVASVGGVVRYAVVSTGLIWSACRGTASETAGTGVIVVSASADCLVRRSVTLSPAHGTGAGPDMV